MKCSDASQQSDIEFLQVSLASPQSRCGRMLNLIPGGDLGAVIDKHTESRVEKESRKRVV